MSKTHRLHKDTLRGIVAGLLAAFIWGAFPVVTKLGVETGSHLDNLDITVLRFGISGIILLPFLLAKGLNGVNWKAIVLMVIGAGVPYMLVVSLGLTYAPAAHFGVITPSTMLVFSAIFGWLVLGETLNTSRLIGLVIIIMGVVCIGWTNLFIETNHDGYLGDLCFIAGGILWGVYTIATKKWGVAPLHSTAIVSVFSMLILLPFYIIQRGISVVIDLPFESITQGIYQGVFSAILALYLYSHAVSLLGAAQGAIFAALVPVIAIVLSIPVLQEIPTTLETVGACVVTIGMLFSLGLHKKNYFRVLKT